MQPMAWTRVETKTISYVEWTFIVLVKAWWAQLPKVRSLRPYQLRLASLVAPLSSNVPLLWVDLNGTAQAAALDHSPSFLFLGPTSGVDHMQVVSLLLWQVQENIPSKFMA